MSTTINLNGPGGNVFYILGAFLSLVKQMDKAGMNTIPHHELLSKATEYKYEEILDRVLELSNGQIKFIGRKRKHAPKV